MAQKSNKRVTVSLPYNLDLEFRGLASKKFKFEKGWYSKAMVDAIRIWMIYNENTLLKEGISKLSHFAGKTMWNNLKENSVRNLEFKSNQEILNHVLNYFNNESPYIQNLDYRIYEQNIKICVDCPCITEKNEDFMLEDLIYKYLQPISLASRAGIEDITGNTYKLSKVKIGSLNKIYLKKIDDISRSI